MKPKFLLEFLKQIISSTHLRAVLFQMNYKTELNVISITCVCVCVCVRLCLLSVVYYANWEGGAFPRTPRPSF